VVTGAVDNSADIAQVTLASFPVSLAVQAVLVTPGFVVVNLY
jgi:hypothetical protein